MVNIRLLAVFLMLVPLIISSCAGESTTDEGDWLERPWTDKQDEIEEMLVEHLIQIAQNGAVLKNILDARDDGSWRIELKQGLANERLDYYEELAKQYPPEIDHDSLSSSIRREDLTFEGQAKIAREELARDHELPEIWSVSVLLYGDSIDTFQSFRWHVYPDQERVIPVDPQMEYNLRGIAE